MPDRIRELIELERKGETVDLSRLNKGFDAEVAARIAKVRQTIDRELTKGAESRQKRSHEKGAQPGWTKTVEEPACAETPQTEVSMEERKGILDNLKATVSTKETKGALAPWMGGLGLGCALLSLSYGTDRRSGDEDKESEKSATRRNPQFEGGTRPKRN